MSFEIKEIGKVNNYSIKYDDTTIYLASKYGECFTSYNDELLELFCSGELGTVTTNGEGRGKHLKFEKWIDKKNKSIYLHHLAFCSYHRGLTRNNYISVLADFKEEMARATEHEKNVEHINSDNKNNKRYNLTLVNKGLNSSKGNSIKYIEMPYIFNAVLGSDNKYRMAIGKAETVEELLFGNGRLLITDNYNDIVKIIKVYKELYSELFKDKDTKDKQYLFREDVLSEALASLSASLFTPLQKFIDEVVENTVFKQEV